MLRDFDISNRSRLTRILLLGISIDQAQAFYGETLGIPAFREADGNVLFGFEGCALWAGNRDDFGVPALAIDATVFQSSGTFHTCAQNHPISLYEPVVEEGRLAWFSGPSKHLHCLWEVGADCRVSSSADPPRRHDPRLAYYFLGVEDLRVAIQFYRNFLGLPLIEIRDGLYALFNAGGIILGLRQGRDAGAGVDAPSWAVFETGRFDDFYHKISTGGAFPLGIRNEPHGRVGWFRAPGGHIQCFHDPAPDYALESILKREPIAEDTF
jgi:catechol 2,3-dioxygenase-like lactoylglutathione lyase family enzyme